MVDGPSHVMAVEVKAVAQIRAMREMALIAGVKVNSVATAAARFCLKML